MKKQNKKLTTLILAGALGFSAILGSAALNGGLKVYADDVQQYNLTTVFEAENGVISGSDLNGKNTTKFSIKKEDTVSLKRKLALKWCADKQDQYMAMEFAFEDLSFGTADFILQTESSLTGKTATNTIRFESNNATVKVSVIADGEEESGEEVVFENVAAKEKFTLQLAEGGAYNELAVRVSYKDKTETVGVLKNIGSHYADYDPNEGVKTPFSVKATGGALNLFLLNINGQAFDNVTSEGTEKKVHSVTDTAAPVIVINETINSFLRGTSYNVEYVPVDVLDDTISQSSVTDKYYQFNPTDTALTYKTLEAGTTSSSTFFMDTYYKDETDGETTVYRKFGEEYVSVTLEIKDKSGKTGNYDLATYAEDTVQLDELYGEKYAWCKDVSFIRINETKIGPTYKAYTQEEKDSYQEKLQDTASKVYAGTGAKMTLPSLDAFIEDDNGYKGLTFTVCYKTETSNLTHTKLTDFPTTTIGEYEFRVFAVDKAGNAMKAVLNDELVEVTSSNIWDFEESEIPTFSFEVKNRGLMVEEETTTAASRTVTKEVGKTYSLSGLTVVGGSNQQSEFSLYKVDMTDYNAKATEYNAKKEADAPEAKKLTSTTIASISYAAIQKEIEASTSTDKSGMDFYLKLLMQSLNVPEELEGSFKASFVEIVEYDDELAETEKPDNKYEWKKGGTSSVKLADEGEYVIVADYWDSLLPTVSRTAAYKVVVVDSKSDSSKGDSEWLENNIVSVILFSVAAVLLIIIIILLFIKPSEETLEDIDKEAKKKDEDKNE